MSIEPITNEPTETEDNSDPNPRLYPLKNTHNHLCMIWVRFRQAGFHRYPKAPDEVAYLRDIHRHEFHFEVGIQVFSDDREIEFHMFSNWLKTLFAQGDLHINHKSCEMLANDIADAVSLKYNCYKRNIQVTVSEDGECGATLTFAPPVDKDSWK